MSSGNRRARWSASAIGAYERGFRTLSLPRLHELAEFYDVSVSVLLGEQAPSAEGPPKLVLDLEALGKVARGGTRSSGSCARSSWSAATTTAGC